MNIILREFSQEVKKLYKTCPNSR